MTYRPTKAAFRKLFALASEQGGYFTAKQAAEAGYNYPHLDYHVRAKNFQRVGHGFYRLPDLPPGEHDDLVWLGFWSRNRSDAPQAVVSHQTALAVHGLSDLVPSRIHLTVPPAFRKAAPKRVVLHRERLDAADVEERPGYSVTTPLRTLLDITRDDTVAEDHLRAALEEALQRGLVRRSKLDAAAKKLPRGNRLSQILVELP